MIRRLIIEAILFAFPFIAYFGSRALARRLKPGVELPDYGRRMPLLVLYGTVLAIGGFLLTWALEPRHVDQTYTPARVDEDGEVTRGSFSAPDSAPKDEVVLTPMQKAAQERDAAAADRSPEP
ncbi:MAG: hypothetical protein ABWZ40_01190 [Caulobacterales bacterium]